MAATRSDLEPRSERQRCDGDGRHYVLSRRPSGRLMLDMCVWLYDGASVVVGGEHRYRLVDDVEAALQEIGVDTVAVTDRGRFLLLRLAPTAQHEGETRTQ